MLRFDGNFMSKHFFRTTFSAEGTTTKQTTTQLQFQKQQCFFGAENIRKVPGFNPSANEKPLEFNVSARSVDENQIFDGKLGVLDIRKSLSKMEKVPFNTGKYIQLCTCLFNIFSVFSSKLFVVRL